jgi:hypothetical protein
MIYIKEMLIQENRQVAIDQNFSKNYKQLLDHWIRWFCSVVYGNFKDSHS